MVHIDAGRYWDANAEAWTTLTRRGYDVYRDHLNTPAFFEMLPDVAGLSGLDVGCGEGHNTRLLSGRGARRRPTHVWRSTAPLPMAQNAQHGGTDV